MERPMIDPFTFLQNKELLQKLFNQFTKEMDKELTRSNGRVNREDTEKAIKRTYNRMRKLSLDEKHICEGFFDTYLGAWNMTGDRESANRMISAMMDIKTN